MTFDHIHREEAPHVGEPGTVDLLVGGPECVHFSRARGGKPVREQKRASAWHVLDWVVVGGESAPDEHRREMRHEWADEIRRQCRDEGIPFYFKQSSATRPEQGTALTVFNEEYGVFEQREIREFPDLPTVTKAARTDAEESEESAFFLPGWSGRMATTEPTSDSEQNSGFDFGNPVSEHDVTIAYNWRYVDSLYVTEDGIKRSQDTDGYPAEDGNDAVQCSCGEEFDSVEEGRTHLKRVGALSMPPLDVPRAVTWRDERTKIHDGCVEVVPNRSKALGKVVKGADYLVATARETYHPPERFQFENWDPLVDGPLAWGDRSPLFRSRWLRRALGAIAPTADYQPERYTIHFRGKQGLFIEGASTGILVAHVINDDF